MYPSARKLGISTVSQYNGTYTTDVYLMSPYVIILFVVHIQKYIHISYKKLG